jgi:hypothetical protein
VPTQQEIEELQRFYQVQKGVKPQEFPPHYPTSCLLGCVDVEDVLPQEEYRSLQKMCFVRYPCFVRYCLAFLFQILLCFEQNFNPPIFMPKHSIQ